MPVEFRDLRWAITTSQHRSLRQAAETLNIRQSTLSRRLRALEHQLGSALFERTNGGTRPTIEGQEFLEAARRIIAESEAIAIRFKTRARGESGRLTIGVHARSAQEICAPPLSIFVDAFLTLNCSSSMDRAITSFRSSSMRRSTSPLSCRVIPGGTMDL